MSISEAVITGLKFAAVGAGLGAAAGIIKVTAFGPSEPNSSYPTSLREAKHVHAHDDAYNALGELSHLRYHAPETFDALTRNMDRLLMSETMVKSKASIGDRKSAIHWRMEAKRSADVAIKMVRVFRSVVEGAHPGALEVFDDAAAGIQSTVDGAIHNVLMESSSMIT